MPETNETIEIPADPDVFKALEPIGDTKVAPAVGIAAMALNFALKYHDISTIQDGTLYQQYKLEGRNMRELHLDMVFETAMKIEAHLLGSSERIARMVADALLMPPPEDDDPPAEDTVNPDAASGTRSPPTTSDPAP